ncbi:alpha/beta fold hydrolase [Streptomyces altiplanensis]
MRIRTVVSPAADAGHGVRDGVRGDVHLTCRDHEGRGRGRPPVLLLHGLAGHAAEWDALAELLAPTHHVIAYDARGHGTSTRRPPSVSRASYVRDVLAVIDGLSLGPVSLVGQSMGGHTAMLTAAAHPDRVASLTLIEAGPKGPDPGLPATIADWLASWPVPFPSRSAAAEFFGGGAAGRAWAAGLEERPDGWHPRVDRDVMVATVAENAERDFWAEWDGIRCPTLVVRGAQGWMPRAEAEEMRARRPLSTRTEVIPDAAHDVHLDNPRALHATLTAFLTRSTTTRAPGPDHA